MTQTPNIFDEDLERAFQRIRGAMTELLSSVSADPSRPQDLARRFQINKNLAWKVSKMIMVSDPHQMVPNIPGKSGMKTVLDAFEAHGASDTALSATRGAFNEFDEMVRMHLGDRSTLQLALTSGTPEKVTEEHLHATRKMAYQGNSAIWGIQARVRMASFFIAPNPDDPSMLDTASVGGLFDVRRLRQNVGVPLFSRFSYNDDGTVRDGPIAEPILPSGDSSDDLMLMNRFCSSPSPVFEKTQSGGLMRYMLKPGPIGNHGRQSWVYGEVVRRFANVHRDEINEFGEHMVSISLPTEWLVCDLHVHQDFDFAFDPEVFAHTYLGGDPTRASETEFNRLPLSETVQSIGSNPAVVASPLLSEMPQIVECVYDRMSWDRNEFYGYRFLMKYPPLHACVIMRHGLKG